MTADEVARELSALAGFYGVKDDFIGALEPWLASYAEVVLSESGFEVLTGGKGCAKELAKAARQFEASPKSVDRFLACDATFPDRMLGLKIEVGAGASVTLYVRLHAELDAALTFLRAPAALAQSLAPAQTIYGLGFFSRGAEAGVKTYTVTDLTDAPFRAVLEGLDLSWPRPGFASHRIADSVVLDETKVYDVGAITATTPRPGFASHRIADSVVLDETKVYLPDVDVGAITATTPRWREVLAFMPGLFANGKCTVGLSARPSAPPEMKLYVERIGAIPNDFSVR